ncbi:MAG: ATP-dependent Clp protease adaptor ClpS [Myxococcales bacterium]|nr:ATP-dependent Clp protease adaptor ClpS [Myxococcales bacterium]
MARTPKEERDTGTITETRKKEKLQKPRMYKVLLHNDHYTTREFVVAILMDVFRKSETDAVQIMMHVHRKGVGVAGVYTHDVAATKIEAVIQLARANEFPLMLTMEPEDD